jgi:hypothetical protein
MLRPIKIPDVLPSDLGEEGKRGEFSLVAGKCISTVFIFLLCLY